MKRIFIVIFALTCAQNISAQLIENLNIGLETNAIWYNDDKKTGDFYDDVNDDGDDHIRANSYLKLDYTFLENFMATVQFESYEPLALLNYSPNFNETNIATYSLNYKTEKLDVTAGHFYEQFGSGLILRTWEDRQLGLNNALLGGNATYMPTDYLSVTGLYAKQRVGFDTSEGEIFGFNSEVELTEILNLDTATLSFGASYVGRKDDIPETITDPDFNELTNAFSGRLDFTQNNFYSSVEYINKSEDAIVQFGNINPDFIKGGSAFLLNTGYSKKGLGVDLTLRRLENMNFYSDRAKAGNVYNENVVNYIPALTKQHDYLLTNIYVYQAQPGVSFLSPSLLKAGEIGGQLDVFYKVKKGSAIGGKTGMKIAANASYWANLDGDFDYAGFDYDTDLFGFGEKYYSDFNLEVRKKWNSKWSSIFYYVNQYYNKKFIEDSNGEVKTNIGVVESTYKFAKGKSVRVEAQHLWAKEDKKNWVGGTVELNLNSNFSFYVNDIYNYGNDDDDKQIHYYNVGGSFTKGATRLGLSYGRQRGGLLCVGGVCRVVSESTGLTLNLTTTF